MIKKYLAILGCAFITETLGLLLFAGYSIKFFIAASLILTSAGLITYASELEHKEKYHSEEKLEILDAKITIEGKRKVRL